MQNTAKNDATLQKAGDIYQYLIALKDCFELKEDETLYIESYGDVSVISKNNDSFQKEVKHHFEESSLSDRDIDFWKTLANWYDDHTNSSRFNKLILCTTSTIPTSSNFYNWNNLMHVEKFERLKAIGKIKKKKEKTFRKQYERIFNSSLNQELLLNILDRFEIRDNQNGLPGYSMELSKYIGHIPQRNRDRYVGALLGIILLGIKNPPHRWQVTREEFDKMLQEQSSIYGSNSSIPLPTEFTSALISDKEKNVLEQKEFIKKIKDIDYEKVIPDAMSDYWKTNSTIAKYFQDNPMYLKDIDNYKNDLCLRLNSEKELVELDISSKQVDLKGQILESKKLYNKVMLWNTFDFGSIIQNRDFFQHGIIHEIIDTTDFKWKVGENENEH